MATGNATVVVSTKLDAKPAAMALRAAAREYRVLAEAHEEAAVRLEALGALVEPVDESTPLDQIQDT